MCVAFPCSCCVYDRNGRLDQVQAGDSTRRATLRNNFLPACALIITTQLTMNFITLCVRVLYVVEHISCVLDEVRSNLFGERPRQRSGDARPLSTENCGWWYDIKESRVILLKFILFFNVSFISWCKRFSIILKMYLYCFLLCRW